jgi:hypothetical protein
MLRRRLVQPPPDRRRDVRDLLSRSDLAQAMKRLQRSLEPVQRGEALRAGGQVTLDSRD